MFKAFLKNIAKVFFGELVSKLFLFLSILIIIRYLSIEEFANYVIFDAVMVFFSFLIGDGINQVIVLYSSEYISLRNESPLYYYISNVILQIFIYLVLIPFLLVFSKKISLFLFNDVSFTTPMILGLISALGLIILNATRSIYQSQEKFSHYVKIIIIYRIFIFILLLLLMLTEKINFLNIAIVICIGTLSAGLYFLMDTLSKIKAAHIILEKLKSVCYLILRYWEYVLFTIISHISWRVDIFMLSHLSTKLELANYAIAYKFYSFGLLLVLASHSVVLPMFAKIQNQNVAIQKRFIIKWLSLTSLFIIVIAIYGFFGKPLLLFFIPHFYSKAFYISIILLFALWMHLMLFPFFSIILSLKKLRFFFILGITRFCIITVLNCYLTAAWGGYGAAIAIVADLIVVYTFVCIKLYNTFKKKEM